MGGGISAKHKRKHEFIVLVTGMGPFPDGQGGHWDENQNSSHLITQHLPTSLPIAHPLNPTGLPIRILNPTAPSGCFVKTEYAYIRSFVQKLWDEHEDEVDMFYHLGMAYGWEHFTIERLSFNEKFTCAWWGQIEAKEGFYMIPDDKGETVRDIDGGMKGMWDAAPMGLHPIVDVDRAAADSMLLVNDECDERGAEKSHLAVSIDDAPIQGGSESRSEEQGKKSKMSVLPHLDAGPYGCGFIYYESLATRWKRKSATKVLFTHVPGWTDPERLERGADVICAIIGAAFKNGIQSPAHHLQNHLPSSNPHLPTGALFAIETTTTIIGPLTAVKSALISYDTWPTWNSFIPLTTLHTSPPPPVLEVGTRLTFHTRMKRGGPIETKFSDHEVTAIDDFEFEDEQGAKRKGARVVWKIIGIPGGRWGLWGERVQELRELGDEKGVSYWSLETFGGPLARVLGWIGVKRLLVERFKDWADDLKGFVEGKEGVK